MGVLWVGVGGGAGGGDRACWATALDMPLMRSLSSRVSTFSFKFLRALHER